MAFRPLRDMFVFSGRSRRTEVLAFFILGMFANALSVNWPGGGEVFEAIRIGWSLLWTFPWVALLVRRLHDQGRSARWAWALTAVFAALTASAPLLPQSADSNYHVTIIYYWTFHPVGPLAVLDGVLTALFAFTLLVLFLAPEEPGTNRYGPDPRLEPDTAALATE
jgi:uncharacterized membrane protein YhaH (DUF805 family)